MFELIKAGGWLMLPLIVCSILAFAIIVERFWSLQRSRISPPNLVGDIWQHAKRGELDIRRISDLRAGSPLGRVLAAGLVSINHGRQSMKESIEETGRHVASELERHLNMLGTIASISPLLGLLGTVTGMVKVFTAISVTGGGNTAALAGGISEALITTVAGMSIAIPALMFY
ncbi:MAG: MotA/TolQ/ExbB proton channel family protein, partial [Chromatiales bacterium]|nr:MotA/TolQ/ExbB proton channel family protein [Chromatiales bacterium]